MILSNKVSSKNTDLYKICSYFACPCLENTGGLLNKWIRLAAEDLWYSTLNTLGVLCLEP